MKTPFFFFFIFCVQMVSAQQTKTAPHQNIILVIHGGAGTILRESMSPEKEKAYKESLERALETGYAILKRRGSALDAVEAAVRVLEDDSLFNAGKGAVFTHDGKIELDAAIMNGKNLAAGSVAGVIVIKNPLSAARAVMDKTRHVMLIGKGADAFAKEQGLEIVDPDYFFTQERWQSLQKMISEDSMQKNVQTDSTKTSKAAGKS